MSIKTIDWLNERDYTGTTPFSLSFYGKGIGCDDWTVLCTRFFEETQKRYPEKIENLAHLVKKDGGFSCLFIKGEKKAPTNKKARKNRLNDSNVWLKVGCDANAHFRHIRELSEYCNLDFSKIVIQYEEDIQSTSNVDDKITKSSKSKYKTLGDNPKTKQTSQTTVVNVLTVRNLPNISQVIKDVLISDYPQGFEFNNSTIEKLREKVGGDAVTIKPKILKKSMYKRCDGYYFPYDYVIQQQSCNQICKEVNYSLENFMCFELKSIYKRFCKNFNSACIRDEKDFEKWFYSFFDCEIVSINEGIYTENYRIVYLKSTSLEVCLVEIVNRIEDELKKSGGTLKEERLLSLFNLFSTDLLEKIIQENTDDIVVTKSNGQIQFQTFNALGLPSNLSEELMKTITRIDELGLEANLDTINTLLSNNFGYNFRFIFNVLNDRVCRRLIETYYHGASREWKDGFFEKIEK